MQLLRLFRRIPERQSAEVAKANAIALTWDFILIAFATGLLIAFGLPPLLSLFLRDNTSEVIKKVLDIAAGILTGGLLMRLSWDQVSTVVGAAVEESAVKKFEIYQREVSSPELIKKQNREFLGMLTLMEGTSTSARECQEYNEDRENAIARQTILRTLSGEGEFLEEMALAACNKILRRGGSSYDTITNDSQLTIFWQDLNFYLKAWLILSVDNGRPMPVSYIKQRFPNQNSPDKLAYIQAITFIKDKLIEHPETRQKLGEQNQEIAIRMLKGYLNILVERLRYPISDE